MGNFLKALFFFFLGMGLTALVLVAGAYLIFSAVYRDKIYPGVKIAGQDPQNLHFDIDNLTFNFNHPIATLSATSRDLQLQPDWELMHRRAYSIGRQTPNPYYNFLQIIAAWQGKIDLPPEVKLDNKLLEQKIDALAPLVEKEPVDAVYQFLPGAGPDGRGRVTAFIQSSNGIKINRSKIEKIILEQTKEQMSNPQSFTILHFPLPLETVPPVVSSTTADTLGIKHLLGRGESYFYDSIPGRIYNIQLGSSKINGSLIAPGETFSFNQAIGTVSALFGFQKAYVIKDGKTVLGDGGGVCQVSTTLYRAALNAGLPIVERAPHSYRVGFYEQGGFPPGTDATVYPPKPDLKFKNDTPGWILVQTIFDRANHKLTFDLFGTDDGRKTTIKGPYILSSSPPPPPVYEDDPNLPAGQIKQVDTAHWGARTYFERKVIRHGEVLIDEVVKSDYVPWPARYLRGTKTD